MLTRRLNLSARQIAERGDRYTDAFLGLQVAHTTSSGDVLVGVVESFANPADRASGYPIIRFPDGRWARGERVLQVVIEQGVQA
jgi:hypothetical protein